MLRLTLYFACSLALLVPSLAAAQDTEQQAQRALEEAQAHAEAGRHALAAERYLEGYELMREAGMRNAPLALWSAGDQLSQIPGRERDAIDTIRRFLAESSPLADDAAQVRDWRSNALSRLDELEARAPAPETLELEEDDTSDPEQTVERSEHLSPIGPVVLGAGIAALGVGAVFGALALVDESSLVEMCGGDLCLDTEEHRSLHNQMLTFANVSDALLITGGLVAITGIVLLFALDPETEDVAPQAACTDTGCWAGVAGSF